MKFRNHINEARNEVTLKEVAYYSNEKIDTENININNYVSTENLLSNFGGKKEASGLPKTKSVTKYDEEDILVSNIRPYFKKVWFASGDGGASNDVLVIKARTNIDKAFLYYCLANENFIDFVMSGAKGTKMPRGDKNHILSFNLRLPPVREQIAIANTLSRLDKKIEVNNQINDTLENMAQELFKRWFVDFEFPNENGEPYKSSGGVMIESELGMIPKGWESSRLDSIANITMGQSPKGTSYNEAGNGIIFYQGRTDFGKRYPQKRMYTTEPKRTAEKDDILMSVRAPVGDINIANEKCCIGRGLAALNSKEKANSFLLYTLINLRNKFNVFNGEGTVFGSINQQSLKSIKVIKPSNYQMMSFEKVVSKIDEKYYFSDMESRRLINVRDTLLPKLMSGEVRVPLEKLEESLTEAKGG